MADVAFVPATGALAGLLAGSHRGPRRLPSHSPRPRLTSRHLFYVLRSRPHWPGLDEQILQAVVDDCTRPVGRRMMTADLRILHPCDTEHAQAVRPQTRAASFYAAVSVAKTTTFPW